MQVLKINKENLFKAIKVLREGGVVVYPTETVYGIGCDPFNTQAVKQIYKIKGRRFNKPFILVADNFKSVKRFFRLNKLEERLAQNYWPGAVTIILKIKNQKSKTQIKNIKSNRAAVRVSPNKVAQDLARGIGGLIVSTSANLSGQESCLNVREVFKQFKNRHYQPDLILDTAKLKKSKPSTIVEVKRNKVHILRQGLIKVDAI